MFLPSTVAKLLAEEPLQVFPKEEELLKVVCSEQELRTVMKLREEHEALLMSADKTKNSLIQYIRSETLIIKRAHSRLKEKGVHLNKMINLAMSINSRIDRTYEHAIRAFPDDLSLWVMYIEFCRNNHNSLEKCRRTVDQMLEYHGHSRPEVFMIAARWELEYFKNTDEARAYIQRGILLHTNNKDLLREAFKIELINVQQKRQCLTDENVMMDPTDVSLTTLRAEKLYFMSIKQLQDLEFVNELFHVCEQYEFSKDLQIILFNEMCLDFNHKERLYDIAAQLQLRGLTNDESSKSKILKCVNIYKMGIRNGLDTQLMWHYYIDGLVKLAAESKVLNSFVRKLLIRALSEASDKKMLEAEHYEQWVDNLLMTEPDQVLQMIDILQQGLGKYPRHAQLWNRLICLHMYSGDDISGFKAFEMAVDILKYENPLPICKHMVLYTLINAPQRVQDVYRKSFGRSAAIDDVMKPKYLEWLVTQYGINATRNVYLKVAVATPHCLQLHKKMMYIERMQPELNVKRMRLIHKMACEQFGQHNYELWLDYMTFEIKSGCKSKVLAIYSKAEKTVDCSLIETFRMMYSLTISFTEE